MDVVEIHGLWISFSGLEVMAFHNNLGVDTKNLFGLKHASLPPFPTFLPIYSMQIAHPAHFILSLPFGSHSPHAWNECSRFIAAFYAPFAYNIFDNTTIALWCKEVTGGTLRSRKSVEPLSPSRSKAWAARSLTPSFQHYSEIILTIAELCWHVWGVADIFSMLLRHGVLKDHSSSSEFQNCVISDLLGISCCHQQQTLFVGDFIHLNTVFTGA